MKIKSIFLSLITATTLYSAPQVVVFDFGGVMTGESNRELVVTFLRNTFELSEKEFEEANRQKKEAVKQGLTDLEFWTNFAKKKGINLPNDWAIQFKAVMKEAINPNQEMYDLVDQLKLRDIKVAMLSNIDKRLSTIIREFGLYEPFPICLLSCDIGFEKPQREAYEILLNALEIAAEEVVFIDDKLENVEAAQLAGLDAILFQSTLQIRQELKERFRSQF